MIQVFSHRACKLLLLFLFNKYSEFCLFYLQNDHLFPRRCPHDKFLSAYCDFLVSVAMSLRNKIRNGIVKIQSTKYQPALILYNS